MRLVLSRLHPQMALQGRTLLSFCISMVSVIYIVRHGLRMDSKNPGWRTTARCPQDPGLSPIGWKQAEKLAEHLAPCGIRHIYTSPYLRARQAALPLAERLGLPIVVEDGLSEWQNPEWTQQKPALCEEVPLDHSLVRVRFPETDLEAWERAGKTARLLVAASDGPVALITHGHTMCGAAFGLLGRRDVVIDADYGAVAEIRFGPTGATLVRAGDRSYLGAYAAAPVSAKQIQSVSSPQDDRGLPPARSKAPGA